MNEIDFFKLLCANYYIKIKILINNNDYLTKKKEEDNNDGDFDKKYTFSIFLDEFGVMNPLEKI